MLSVSKKVQESVTVRCPAGSECRLKVTVLGIKGQSVKLGYESNRAQGWRVCPHRCEGARTVRRKADALTSLERSAQ
jgi:sRNA-binding carbon storage regulator CsrA